MQIPSLKDRSLIGRHKSLLNGDSPNSLGADVLVLHHMLSYLKYTIKESPSWWQETDYGYDLYDMNIIEHLFDKVIDFEQAWLKEIWGEELEEETPKELVTEDLDSE